MLVVFFVLSGFFVAVLNVVTNYNTANFITLFVQIIFALNTTQMSQLNVARTTGNKRFCIRGFSRIQPRGCRGAIFSCSAYSSMLFLWPYNNNMQASSTYTLEIAVFNFRSALIAANAGASRIELCENAAEGGTTPSYGTLKLVRE